MTIAVTGATGTIGRGVFDRIAAEVPVRLVGRSPERLTSLAAPYPEVSVAGAEYGDADAMASALAGTETLFFVSGREDARRRADQETAVAAAQDAGVSRIVYLSFLGAGPECTFTFGRDHYWTEVAIRETGLAYTFLRDSWYQSMLPAMVEDDGVIRGPAADGRVSAVAPEDVMDSAAAVLLATAAGEKVYDEQVFELTGPEAFTLDDAAATLTTVTGRRIRYVDQTTAEAYLSRETYGAPRFEVDGWVTSYAAVATGELSTVTGDVAALTGHEPKTFEQYLRDKPESWTRLVG
ncbi:NAD(P)H-binding protein [Rhodococcus sp. HNM0569]|uniref:NAD(P)H-binding protein n=1 Tax=Rhodococcus sp. HNM0569 TaxID=2716340 RepID=UPI00146E9F50|nr:NAD(P)H-binding protein [Rhodococcus sp. HNM0569]NLU85100.1 NAD(P)H-binding protein [Rhodococcus sp. HNM0569]